MVDRTATSLSSERLLAACDFNIEGYVFCEEQGPKVLPLTARKPLDEASHHVFLDACYFPTGVTR